MKQYDREFLLSFAEKDFCKQRPEALDPMLSRDSPSPEIVESGAPPPKFVPRRERDFPQDVPEWRRPPNGSGLLPQQANRRKSFEEDGVWVEARSQQERAVPAARWEHRGRGGHQDEPDRSGATRGNWTSTEPDGLLGSGNGLRGPGMGGRGSNGRGRGSRSNDSRFTKSYREEDPRYGEEDTFNAETFGQSESDDSRAEQERRRRESFELERKEQQRLKEQKRPVKKRDLVSEDDDMDALIGPATAVERDLPNEICVMNHSQTIAVAPPPSTAPRPLVPPGFGHAKPIQKKDNHEAETNGVEEPVDKPVVLERSSSSLVQKLDPIVVACSNISVSEPASCSDEFNPLLSPFLHSKLQVRGQSLNSEDKDAKEYTSLSPKGVTASAGRMLPMPVGPSLQDIEKDIVTEAKTVKAAAGAFTCQDIEQTLLAEAESKAQGTRGGQKEGGSGKDSDVSHKLLALLQKGSARQWDEDFSDQSLEPPPPTAESTAKVTQEGGAPTLESLFGRAFMMELRSTDAPLSAKVAAETKYIDNLSLVRKPHKLEDGLTEMLPHDKNSKLVETVTRVPLDAGLNDQFKYQRAKEPRQEPPVREMDGLAQDSSIVDYAASSNGHIDGVLPGFFPPKASSLQQVHQALSKPPAGSNKQFQPGLSPPNMFEYGAPEGGYGRPVNVHPQGIYGGHLPTPQGFGSPFFLEQEHLKQRGQAHGTHPFPPNGSVHFQQQQPHLLNQLLLQRQQKHGVPVMGYHLSGAGGYMGHPADEHAAAAAAATDRWLGRDPSTLVHQQQQQQQQRMYGNKLGFR